MASILADLLWLDCILRHFAKEDFTHNLSTTSTSTSSKTTPSSGKNLLTLPQELIDLIINYAYPHQDHFRIISRERWDHDERERCRSSRTHITRPFSAHKVNDFLVSKRFFIAAAGAFIGNQTFHCRTDAFYGGPLSSLLGQGVIFHDMAATKTYCWYTSSLRRLPRLKHVTLEVDESLFEALEPKYAWREILTAEDFRATRTYKYLMQCPSLQTCTTVPEHCYYAHAQQEQDLWVRNVAAFAALVVQDLKKRELQPSVGREDASSPLYAGSKVSFGASRIRWHAQDHGRIEHSIDLGEDLSGLTTAFSEEKDGHEYELESLSVSTPPRTQIELLQLRARKTLEDKDLPEHVDDFLKLMYMNGEAVMEWVRFARDATCTKPLKGKCYNTPRAIPRRSRSGAFVETVEPRSQTSDAADVALEASTVGSGWFDELLIPALRLALLLALWWWVVTA